MNVITTARRMRGSSSSSKAFARRSLSMTLTTGRSGTSVVIISRHFTDGAETNQCLKAKSLNSLLKGFEIGLCSRLCNTFVCSSSCAVVMLLNLRNLRETRAGK